MVSRAPDSPVKIIDFSMATFFYEASEPGGTPEFMAPELVADPEGMAGAGESMGSPLIVSFAITVTKICLSVVNAMAGALECFKGNPAHNILVATGWGPEVDMWAVGIIIYFLICGQTPFDDTTVPRIFGNIQRGRSASNSCIPPDGLADAYLYSIVITLCLMGRAKTPFVPYVKH